MHIPYIGKSLPSVVIGFLMIYCFKNVSLLSGSHGIRELIGVAVVALLHFWKKKMLLYNSNWNDYLHDFGSIVFLRTL